MKLKDVKKWVNKLSKADLERDLLYNSVEYSISGVVQTIKKSNKVLYNDGSDDPYTLKTRKDLVQEGYTSEEIAEFDREIDRGDIIIEL